MTCEVTILNRHAIALAADSAVTVERRQANGETQTKYYKSVNKIFNLSSYHPVGMMIYGTGDLQQVPWEILAKEYRKKLSNKSFDTLDEYAHDLFLFLQNATDIFPPAYQDKKFIEAAKRAVIAYTYNYLQEFKEGKLTAEQLEDYLVKSSSNLSEKSFPENYNNTDVQSANEKFGAQILEDIREILKELALPEKILKIMINFGIEGAIKTLYMPESGLVIAGYGDKDFFPGFREYKCHGNILGKVAYTVEDSKNIDFENSSHIKPFATTSTINSFLGLA